jgi:parallel beta-helix repeat protein
VATVYSRGTIGLRFLDNEIENGYAMAIDTEDTSASFLSRNNLHGTYGPGIYIGNDSHEIVVANNTINKPQGTVSNSHGDGIAVAATAANATISGVIVDANSVYQASALGFCFEAGNFIAGSVDFTVVSGVTFSGNSCVRPANLSGSFSYGGFSLSVISDSVVTGNKDYDQGSFTSVGPIAGIEIICSRCDVSGNQLYSASVTGSANGITGSYDGSTISNNVVNGFYLHAAGAGIENHTTPYHTGISGNTITGNIVTLPPGAAQGLRGIAISCEHQGCVADNQRVVENVVVGNSAALADSSEGIVFADNTAGGAVSMASPVFDHNSFHQVVTGILSAGSFAPGIANAWYFLNTCLGCTNQYILTGTTTVTVNAGRQATIPFAPRPPR